MTLQQWHEEHDTAHPYPAPKPTMQKLELTANTQPEQVIKHYFYDFSVKMRKEILKSCPFKKIEEINEFAFSVYNKMEQEKESKIPLLFESIIYNSLGFEKNEELKNTIYQDYHNKAISKFAKPFINGQYGIFTGTNEKLILNDYNNTNEVTLRLDNTIKELSKMTIEGIISLEALVKAANKNPSAVLGIVNKINKL